MSLSIARPVLTSALSPARRSGVRALTDILIFVNLLYRSLLYPRNNMQDRDMQDVLDRFVGGEEAGRRSSKRKLNSALPGTVEASRHQWPLSACPVRVVCSPSATCHQAGHFATSSTVLGLD